MVLDEAHTIKSSKSQVSMAASALIADNRWCLTGTPIQVNHYIISLLLYNILFGMYELNPVKEISAKFYRRSRYDALTRYARNVQLMLRLYCMIKLTNI